MTPNRPAATSSAQLYFLPPTTTDASGLDMVCPEGQMLHLGYVPGGEVLETVDTQTSERSKNPLCNNSSMMFDTMICVWRLCAGYISWDSKVSAK
jgi:hypothetical protein